MEEASPAAPATPRLSELAERYLVFCAAIDRSPHTRETLRVDLALLVRFLGDRSVRAVDLDDLRRYVVWLRQERKNDARSLRRKIASVKGFFAYARQESARADDPAEKLIYPEAAPHLPEILEGAEAERLIAAAERPSWRAVILTLLDAGLKRDELLALHPGDVSLDPAEPERSYLAIRAASQAQRIRARVLRLTPRLAEALRRQVETTPGDRLFPISVRMVNVIVETCGARAGLRKRGTIRPQMLRDTFAVREVRRRVATETQRRAGGATAAELAELRRGHDQEVCDLLGLTPGPLNDPIARYRLLVV